MSDWKNVQYKDGKMRTSEGGGGGGSSTFAGLDDVDFSNLQNGQVPKYNSTTQKWENANESGGGGTVTDVKVDGQSVVDPQTGEANITMPTPPTIPVTDVKVNGTSVVDGNKEAQIKSYKEVTQAEYNALPDSKLNDGILYAIKDSAGADGFPPLIYSDEEREVGVWRDGKPLYQRTFLLSSRISIRNDYTTILINDTTVYNIENLIRYEIYDNNGGSDLQRVRLLTGNVDLVLSNNNQLIASTLNNNAYSMVGYTIQYTKTTDTAGSGTWTTQGGYAHHYSTTEHVIGTWITGKPLYEKTVVYTTPVTISNGSWYTSPETYPNCQLVYGEVLNAAFGYYSGVIIVIENDHLIVGNQTKNQPINNMKYVTIRYIKTTD